MNRKRGAEDVEKRPGRTGRSSRLEEGRGGPGRRKEDVGNSTRGRIDWEVGQRRDYSEGRSLTGAPGGRSDTIHGTNLRKFRDL